jgi:chromate transporter
MIQDYGRARRQGRKDVAAAIETQSAADAAPQRSATAPGPAGPTTLQLFTGFLQLGLMGFGGVLPLSRRVLVEQRRWLTSEEYLELLSLCQFLPGGNITNLAVTVGYRFRGLTGALAAILGVIAAPIVVLIGLGIIYDRFQNDPIVRHMFMGLAAAASGLLISLALKIVAPMRRNPAGIAIALICVIGIAVLKLPLLPTMLLLAGAGMLAVVMIPPRRRLP